MQTSLSVFGLSQVLQLGVLQVVSDTHVCPFVDGVYPLLHLQNPSTSVLTSAGHCGMQPFSSGLILCDEVVQVRHVWLEPAGVQVAQPAVVKEPSQSVLEAATHAVFPLSFASTVAQTKRNPTNISRSTRATALLSGWCIAVNSERQPLLLS